jgi:hypothetical protein
MGSSKLYTVFARAVETVGGLLMFIPRDEDTRIYHLWRSARERIRARSELRRGSKAVRLASFANVRISARS